MDNFKVIHIKNICKKYDENVIKSYTRYFHKNNKCCPLFNHKLEY